MSQLFLFLVTPESIRGFGTLHALKRKVAETIRSLQGTVIDCGTNRRGGRVEGHCRIDEGRREELEKSLCALPNVHAVGLMKEREENHEKNCMLA